MEEDRFSVAGAFRGEHCLVCQHGATEDGLGVVCRHPERPPERRQVIKWYSIECRQFVPLQEPSPC